jgi:hypothetical protein
VRQRYEEDQQPEAETVKNCHNKIFQQNYGLFEVALLYGRSAQHNIMARHTSRDRIYATKMARKTG